MAKELTLKQAIEMVKREALKLRKMQEEVKPDQLVDIDFAKDKLNVGRQRLIANLPLYKANGLRWQMQGQQYSFLESSIYVCMKNMCEKGIDLPRWEDRKKKKAV